MLEKITSKLDIHSLEVLVKSFKTSLVKILGMIGSLLVSIFLGRTLGSEGLGVVNSVSYTHLTLPTSNSV